MENQVNLKGAERAATHTSRMSKERIENAVKQLNEISESDYEKVLGLANVCKPFRSVLHKTPDDYGMTQFPGCKKAVDEFLSQNECAFFYEMPVGGCFIIKK